MWGRMELKKLQRLDPLLNDIDWYVYDDLIGVGGEVSVVLDDLEFWVGREVESDLVNFGL